jgi:O-antigen/teichoic acid export membrane protein
LCLGIPVIAASGIVGTALLSAGRVGLLGAQVGISLSVNIACLFALVPLAGAVGAALATFACELVGLIFLLLSARTALPGLFRLPGRSGPAIEARPVAP